MDNYDVVFTKEPHLHEDMVNMQIAESTSDPTTTSTSLDRSSSHHILLPSRLEHGGNNLEFEDVKISHSSSFSFIPDSLSPDTTGAGAPPQDNIIGADVPSHDNIIGADAPSQDNIIGADAPSREYIMKVRPSPLGNMTGANAFPRDPYSGAVIPKEELAGSSKFSYVSVVSRLSATAAAEAAADAALPTPLPPTPARPSKRKRPADRLTVATRRLPDTTPANHTHRLIGSHPWAQFVTLRGRDVPSNPDFVTNILPLDIYDHIPRGGYLSTRFVRALFPHKFQELPSHTRRLPILELMRLEHAVQFRESSQAIIDQLNQRTYVIAENTLPKTPTGLMPSTTLPERRPHFPVLYQVVSKGVGQGAVLESKDFFVPGPDRRELHLIILDQFATNVQSSTRGFDRSLLSVKDFVWVYSVEPTKTALRDPDTVLEKARIPKATALDQRYPYFFRVEEFVLVTPAPTSHHTLGIILSLLIRFDAVKGLKIAFESAPEAVSVSPSVCDFLISEAEQDEIVTAHARRNVTCAMRFSEFPASREAQTRLCSYVRDFLPAHPGEGLLPLRVFKMSRTDKDWITDRAGDFANYRINPLAAQRKMAQLFNAACSALAAVSCMNDDKRTHMLTAMVPSLHAYPARFDFTLEDMSSECGWRRQRPVYLWIVGSQTLTQATIQMAQHSYENRSLTLRLVVPFWSHNSVMRKIQHFGTMSNGITSIQVCVKLGSLPSGAEPLYALISERQLFGSLEETARSVDVLDVVYGGVQPPTGPLGPPPDNSVVSIRGRSVELRPDQLHALQMGDLGLPVLAIQAAFGTGKTVVGALIAARVYTTTKEMVVATTTTNSAVAQFTDTLLSLDEYRHLDVLRFVSDSALMEGAPQTEIDLHSILKRLPDEYGHLLSDDLYATCFAYKRGRELLERFMFEQDLALYLSDAERDEYRIAERDISDLTRQAVAIMFSVRPPAVICLTTSSLLNSITAGGLFNGLLDRVALLVGDEASQIPEPAMVALSSYLPQTRHVYIGDTHQLEPHARCPRTSNPARFGAQGVVDILLARGVSNAPLTTTFRAHPHLNELPNLMFYQHTLVSGTRAEDRQLFLSAVRCPNPELPFLFVDVPGSSTKALSGSHANRIEAEACREIVLGLLGKEVAPSSMAIIVFYKEQARLLDHFARQVKVDIHTVDSVQGREKDIVILLSTRTDFDPSRGDFLNDPRRLNVALTRCRHGQFVLGHVPSLLSLSHWRRIIQWAQDLCAYTSTPSLPELFE